MNERLGIVEEAQRRAEAFATKHPALRRKIMGERAPPVAYVGPAVVAPEAQPAQTNGLEWRLLQRKPWWAGRKKDHPHRRNHATRDDLEVTPLQIVQAICRISHVTFGDLCGHKRGKRSSRPRQLAVYFIARYCSDLSLTQIAYIFDRHHTTVLHAMCRVRQRIDERDEWTLCMVAKIDGALRSNGEDHGR